MSDKYGRDIRDRLKSQEKIHSLLWNIGVPTPQVDPYFESDNNGYLPMEYIEGEPLEKTVNKTYKRRSWRALSENSKNQLIGLLEQVLSITKTLHTNQFVHRDLTPSNLIVNKSKVWITDFELTYRLDNSKPWFKLGTPGFMSPQQENDEPPVVEDDIYSLGCVMLLIVTGIEPGRLLYAKKGNGFVSFRQLRDDGVPGELVHIIGQCISYDPSERPSISEIIEAAKIARDERTNSNSVPLSGAGNNRIASNKIIQKGLTGMLRHTAQEGGLWLSPQLGSNHMNFSRASNILELKRSIHSGVSGVLYLLARLSQFNRNSGEGCHRAQRSVKWLLQDHNSPDSELPGLYFGDSGVAVSLAESIKSGLVKRDKEIDRFFDRVIRSEIDWPDITHGAAGQGIAGYYCYDILKDPKFLSLPKRCAEYLIKNQNDDGLWSMPGGIENTAGKTFTGFAHGVSGIVYFLIEHFRRTRHSQTKAAYERGLSWLLNQMSEHTSKSFVSWPYSTDSPSEEWKWWCHGSPGIALTFLRLYEVTRDDLYAEIAAKALHVHPPDIRYINLSQCHGLSGIGEIYLEAYRVLGDKEWKIRADNIASVLFNFRKNIDEGVVWAVQDTNVITADLMIGCSGIIHFFLRLVLGGQEMGFPMLPEPLDSSNSR